MARERLLSCSDSVSVTAWEASHIFEIALQTRDKLPESRECVFHIFDGFVLLPRSF